VAQIVLLLSSCVFLEGLVSTIELLTDVCQNVLMETVCEVCIMVAASYCNLPGVLFMMEVYFCPKNSTHYSKIQSAILQTHVSHLHSAMSHTNSYFAVRNSPNTPGKSIVGLLVHLHGRAAPQCIVHH
jgi:hypothetical protein